VSTDDPAVLGVVDTSDVAMRKIVTTESPIMDNMTMNVRLSIARDTWARSPDANVEFYTQGPLTIVKSPGEEGISLDGVVNTERGEYQFLGRRFVLSQGTAIFTGGPEINPLLQLGAQYTIQPAGRPALNINIAINGTVRKPVIVLTSDAQPPLSQSDLLSYLAFGQSSTSLVNSAGGGASGGGGTSGGLVGSAAALATRQLTATALGVMTRQFAATAARSLGADVFTITPAEIPDQGVEKYGVQTILAGTQVEAGKYVDRQTYVATQIRGSGTTPGFVVQRRLSKGYRIEASVDSRYIVNQPTLSTNVPIRSEATFGAFLIREWKF
jgi:translocation and assembly module TamB